MILSKLYSPGPISALALSLFLVACGGSSGGGGDTPPANGGDDDNDDSSGQVNPQFTNITVHDPSVVKVDGEYYVFGSHLSAAKTSDLMNWERVADVMSPANPLFDNVEVELAETLEWAQADTLWAMDIIQLQDGKFYMYYNASKGDEPLAGMGVAVADNIEGPYENKEMFLRSGDKASNGESGYIADPFNSFIHPHVVDPAVFFDQQGNFWMMYGSYSGGIFILEMDPETGLPTPDQGYGKHIMGGNHTRIEASYVLYSPESEYYYLFTSFGGFGSDGAYNIRVARSETPDGPYVDAMGNDMADVKSDGSTIFDDEAIEDGAMKLMGNFRFAGGDGYVSPGHNSAYYEAETSEHLIFFHTRFPGRGEQHEVRVHEMFINANGWPVIAPHRYVPLSESEETLSEEISEAEMPGTYELINHGKEITTDIKTSVTVELAEGGQITGDATGTWFLGEDNLVTVELDGAGAFEGVAARLWSPSEKEFVVTFSALSDQGVAIWASRSND